MPIVVAVCNQKGGSGKSTLAINLADGLKRAGKDVLLGDSDPQGSVQDWSEVNKGEVVPVVGLDRGSLVQGLRKVGAGYEWVIIDGAPRLERISAASVQIADVVLIPIQPSPFDIWACAELVEAIISRQSITEGRPKAAFVVSRAVANTRLGREVREAIEEYGLPVFKHGTTQRVWYPTSASRGQTVFERPSSKAAQEMSSILTELMDFADE